MYELNGWEDKEGSCSYWEIWEGCCRKRNISIAYQRWEGCFLSCLHRTTSRLELHVIQVQKAWKKHDTARGVLISGKSVDVRAVYQPFQWPRFGQIHYPWCNTIQMRICSSNPRFYVVPWVKIAVTSRLPICNQFFWITFFLFEKTTSPYRCQVDGRPALEVMLAIGESPVWLGCRETDTITWKPRVNSGSVGRFSGRTLVKLWGSHLCLKQLYSLRLKHKAPTEDADT